MIPSEFFKQLFHYFVRLPLFSLRLCRNRFSALENISKICPDGPKAASYYDAILRVCNTHLFLKGQSPERLFTLYNLISTIREADSFIYPFLTKKTLTCFNGFHNLEILSESYEKGPVLILYAHTGSYYQTTASTGILGYKVYPIAYGIDLSTMDKPFRWLFRLNMTLSARHFSGGHYLYSNTPSLSLFLKKIISKKEKAILYSAIDLPPSFINLKRLKVPFLGGKTALPYKLIDVFIHHRFPVIIAFSSIQIIEDRLKRMLRFEAIPEDLTSIEILHFYASHLETFIGKNPEQFLNLINLEDFYV